MAPSPSNCSEGAEPVLASSPEPGHKEPPTKDEKKEEKKTTVYLIRHAESLENHRLACIRRSFGELKRLRLPDISDVRTGCEVFNVKEQTDTEVSDRGKRQVSAASTSSFFHNSFPPPRSV